ncbi:MAG: hypothetical protein U0401_27280 [Anaerolineae bacterium]
MAEAAWTLAALLHFDSQPDLGAHPAISLLKSGPNRQSGPEMTALWWLSFIYEPRLMRQVQDNLEHPSPEKDRMQWRLWMCGCPSP